MNKTERILPTFCHINEYQSSGYQDLHRMLAISHPLYLWSPSSVLVSGPLCRITSRQFVEYVERGMIRVMGRSEWLTDPGFRDHHHPWDGARWTKGVDDKLHRLCLEDEGKPDRGHLSLSELLRHPDRATALGVSMGLVTASLDAYLGLGPGDLVGYFLSTISAGYGLARKVGLVPTTFDGEQWPVLYAFRSGGTRKRIAELRTALSPLQFGR